MNCEMTMAVRIGRVLTTGQVAGICGVATRTVVKWCDSGKLPHYKIPVSKDRRILRESLREFLAAYGIPIPPALTTDRLLITTGILVSEHAQLPAPWQLVTEFELGELVATQPVASLIIGDAWGVANAVALAHRVQSKQPRARVAVLVSEDAGGVSWGEVIRRPARWDAVARVLGGPNQ